MKIRVLSDLHLESAPLELPKVDADVVVLAGDIEPVVHGDAPRWAREQFGDRPIVWVLGNHEHYGFAEGVERCIERARRLAAEFDIHLLEDETLVLDEVRFLGCTLWTDFRLQGMPDLSMTRARLGMSDFSGSIAATAEGGGSRYFRPQDSVDIHRRSVAWLHAELAKSYDRRNVVVTHHAPHPRCEHASYVGGLLSPAFCNDLGLPIERYQPVLWISGHTHASHDFKVGSTRLVSNQRGYRDVPEHADAPFRPNLVIEV